MTAEGAAQANILMGMFGALTAVVAGLAILMIVTKIQYGSWWNPYNTRAKR